MSDMVQWVGQMMMLSVDLTYGAGATADTPSYTTGWGATLITLLGYTKWIGLVVCVIGLVVAAGSFAVSSSRGGGEGVSKLLMVAVGVGLVSLGVTLVSWIAPSLLTTGLNGVTQRMQGSLFVIAVSAAGVTLVVGGAKVAWEHRTEDLRRLAGSIGRFAAVAVCGTSFVYLGLQLSSGFSAWLLTKTTNCDPSGTAAATSIGDCVGTQLKNSLSSNGFKIGDLGAPAEASVVGIILMLLALVTLIGLLVVAAVFLVKSAIFVVLVAVLPVASSFTFFKMGQEWFDKIIGWISAFILFEPAVALIYGSAAVLVATPVNNTGNADLAQYGHVVIGLILMAMAAIALPVLMRLCVPAVSAAAGGSGLGATVTAIAGGAIMMKVASGATNAAMGGDSSSPSGSSSSNDSGGGGGDAGGADSGGSTPSSASSSGGASSAPADAGAGAEAAGASGAGAEVAMVAV
ncbi:MAG: hypothetical protein FWF36_09965 [Propionibacteriaceae bacterium]|nr:hypothetical protein [Propionibacteriaceae bacterium]